MDNDRDVKTWRYHIPSAEDGGWAIVFLDSIGCFSALSDYGHYGFRWPESGWGKYDFRDFIAGHVANDPGYLLSKIAPNDIFDGEATMAAARKLILELRRDKELTMDEARWEWSLLENDFASGGDFDSEADFARWLEYTKLGVDHAAEPYLCARSRRPPRAVAFATRVMPRLRAMILAQLAEDEHEHVR